MLVGQKTVMTFFKQKKKSSMEIVAFIKTPYRELIGELKLMNINWFLKEGELYISIQKKQYRNKGYGFDAISVFLDYLFLEKKFKKVYLRVYSKNIRAIKCYIKCGFKKIGILKKTENRYKEIILMEINREDYLSYIQENNIL